MLIVGAIALLVVVVVAIAVLLGLDLRRTEHRHWLDALKTWQQLIGAVLGFLGAAGVLVLSTAIQSDSDARKAVAAAHAIGLGLAYEVQAMGVGLKAAQQSGQADLQLPDPGVRCAGYATTLQQVMVPSTPVYDAVLPRMVDFGDENLQNFVTFYALYKNLRSSLGDILRDDCPVPVLATGYTQLMVSSVDNAMGYYAAIAETYGIASADLGKPASDGSLSSVSSASP